jgi:tripeptide aminopeptidase
MYRINRKRIVRTFTELARIPSPSWKESGVIDYIINSVKNLPVDVKKYPCGESHNLLLTVNGEKKRRPVLFSAHMDTVTPCENIRPVVDDKKISSDGTTILGSDDKAAIAIFLEGLRVIAETGMRHSPMEMLFSCAEEVGLCGIKCFDMSVLRSKCAFVFDSDGRIGKIVLKAPYHSTMNITVVGKAAHAGMEPEKGINAIRILSEIITRLPSGRIDFETTLNVGTITGGRATNIVAEKAACVLEVRSIDKKKLMLNEAIVRQTARDITAQSGARCTVTRTLEYSGFNIKENDPVVRIAADAMRRVGITHQFEVSGGGSDTNVFNRAGIRAVNVSAGMQRVHTAQEFILIKDLMDGANLLLSIVNAV